MESGNNVGALRALALQKIGLTVDSHDFNLQRILDLAQSATHVDGARFCIAEGGVLCSIIETKGATGCYVEQAAVALRVLESAEPYANPDLSRDPVPGISEHFGDGAKLSAFCVLPVFSPDRQVIGTLSLLSRHKHPVHQVTPTLKLLNTYVRLIEDTLLLRSMSVRDALTQLFTRAYFEDQARVEWRRAMRMQIPLSFVLLDLDHFKSFNDHAGNQVADKALQRIAKMVSGICRRAGDMICRYGGEEFAIMLPMTNSGAAMVVAEKLRQAIQDAGIVHPGKNALLSGSCGVSTAETTEMLERGTIESFMDEADRALFAAKRNGRNRCQHVRQLSQADLESEICA